MVTGLSTVQHNDATTDEQTNPTTTTVAVQLAVK